MASPKIGGSPISATFAPSVSLSRPNASRVAGSAPAGGPRPAAPAAAEPLELPPGVRAGSRGLRVGPGAKQAYSVVTVLPTTTAPAPRSRLTTQASPVGHRPLSSTLPFSVG